MTDQAPMDELTPSCDPNDIAVVGMACRLPGAKNVQEFWQNLVDGKDALTTLSDEELEQAGVPEAERQDPNYVPKGMFLDDMECFDAGFFGLSPQDARIMDPQHRHFLECAWEAFEDAGYVPNEIDATVGVYAGSGHNAYLPYNILTNPELKEQLGFFLLRHTGNDKDFLSTRASYIFNWQGPSLNVQTACSTSLVAIHMAGQSLLNGECEVALAGGVTIELPHRQGYVFKENEILSPDGHCRPFEAASGGTIFGSGVGCVVLKRMEDALADGDQIHAVIKSSAINNDGAGKVSYLAPSVEGQAIAASDALEVGEIDPQSVTFIECHGTGTALGDPIEVAALTQAYGATHSSKQSSTQPFTQQCALGSVKSNIGHTDTAAGVAGFIKTVLCLKHKKLVPTLHFDAPNPQIDFASSPFYVNDRLREWHSNDARRAAVSSLGVGGTNAHLILEEAPVSEAPDAQANGLENDFEVLALSARTNVALDSYANRYADYLQSSEQSLNSVCAATLQTRSHSSEHLAQRSVCIASGRTAMQDVLKDPKHALRASHKAAEQTSLGFLFAGGGAQYPNMGKDLYESKSVYRTCLDECLEASKSILDYDLRSVIFPNDDQIEQAKEALLRPTRALPALFVTQWAQAKLWQSWGVTPETMIGHSMGEYTAAALAGVFDMPSALAIVAKRGELFETLPAGAMLSVMLDRSSLERYVGPELSIAAENSQSLNVVAGPVEAIEALQATLESKEIQCRRVMISVAAHSAMLDPILKPFEVFLRTIQYHPPKIKIASNLTGDWLSAEQACDPMYWVRHLRETVRFSEGLSLLLEREDASLMPVLMEVGPGNTLSSLSRQHEQIAKDYSSNSAAKIMVTASMRHPKEDVHDLAFMRLAQGKLWCAGVNIDWEALYAPIKQKISLPTYPFERHRHWIEPGSQTESRQQVQDLEDWFYAKSFAPSPSLARANLVRSEEKSATGQNEIFLLSGKPGENTWLDSLAVDWKARSIDLSDFVSSALSGLKTSKQAVVCYVPQLNQGSNDSLGQWTALKDFFELSKVLLDLDAERGSELDGIKLNIISFKSVSTHVSETADANLQSILGAARVLSHECANLSVKAIDLDGVASDLSAELIHHESRFENVAYRQGSRLRETFTQTSLPALNNVVSSELDREVNSASTDSSRLIPCRSANPVFVVSGGLGGLGLTLAEQLSEIKNASIILLTHRPFSEASQWQSLSDKPGRVGQRASRLLAIENRLRESAKQEVGSQTVGTLRLLTVDVSDEAETEACFAEIASTIGLPTHVFHTAGAIDDQLLSTKSWSNCEAVLRPKVQGAQNIAKACLKLNDQQPVEAFVLYSSVSAQTGMAGQFDYAAANAYLDAYAGNLREQGLPAVAVNWSAWQEVGMAAELAAGNRSMGASYPEFSPYCHEQSVEIYLDAQRWWIDEHRTKAGLALMPGTGFLNHLAHAASLFTGKQVSGNDVSDQTAKESGAESKTLVLSDCFFASPLIMNNDEQKVMSVHFDASSSSSSNHSRTNFQVYSAASPVAAENSDYSAEHVSGSFEWTDAVPGKVDIDDIKSSYTLQKVELNGSPEHAHMAFGPRWGLIHDIHIGEKACLASLSLADDYLSDLSESCLLHPAMLDMATGVAHRLVDGFDAGRDFYVPVSYGRITVFAPLEAQVWSHARWISGAGDHESAEVNSKEGDDAIFAITITDSSGRILVDIEGFRVKCMAANALDNLNAQLGSELDVDLSKSIRPAQGQEALARLLSFSNTAQVVVSPQHFESILAERQVLPDLNSGSKDDAQLDRAGLDSDFAKAETQVQLKLVELWSAALGVDGLGINDNFFELGGHSLLLTQLATKAKKLLGSQVALSVLFDKPTVSDWAEHAVSDQALEPGDVSGQTAMSETVLSQEVGESDVLINELLPDRYDETIPALPREGLSGTFDAPLTPTQSALWYVNEMSGGSSAYHIPLAVKLKGSVNVPALEDAIRALQSRHEILRTTYVEENGALLQRIHAQLPLQFSVENVAASDLNNKIQESIEKPFNLVTESSMRTVLFVSGESDSVLLLNFHHIALDHTALLQLLRELETLYQSGSCNEGNKQSNADSSAENFSQSLTDPALHFADYAHWHSKHLENTQETLSAKQAIWASRLNGFSGVLDLPFDHARPSVPSGRGAQHLFSLPPALSEKLKTFSREHSVSLYISLLASLKVLLHRYAGQDDVIVGTPFANRGDQEALQSVVGCFINTLPLASRLSESPNYLALIDQVKSVMFEAYDNQDVPLNLIADAAKLTRDPSYNPLFQVGFIFQEPPGNLNLSGLESELLPVHSGGAMYDLHFWLWDGATLDGGHCNNSSQGKVEGDEAGISGLVWYNTDVYEPETIARIEKHWAQLLERLIDAPKSDYKCFPMLIESERDAFEASNATNLDIDLSVTLPELFDQQAKATPENDAVVCEESVLTYQQLAERAEILARYLVSQGVQRGHNVGVSIQRSTDMLVSVLAVMKAGACYVPMDPNYPRDRLRYMVEQASVAIVLSSEEVSDQLDYFIESGGEREGQIIKVDSDWADICSAVQDSSVSHSSALYSSDNANLSLPKVSPDDLAYIIFTSGSTGLPKGVQVPHRGVVNFLHSMARKPGITQDDTLLAITTLSFDIAVLELYLPLIVGAKVVIATEDEAIDGHDLKDLIEDHEVSIMQATPSTWRTLLAANWPQPKESRDQSGLKVLCGGEPFPIDLAKTLTECCSEVWNMYGPTETTVWSVCRQVNVEKPNIVGQPIANTTCYVLNDAGQEQPIGVPGELCIGGAGVTQGYLNRPELSEKVFVQVDGFEGVLYRTGDAVKRLANGELEYVQRLDNQVKVRGYRIELGEIEATILKHEAIAECAVLVREYSAVDKRIIAYARFVDASQSLTMTELRKHMRAYLPDYMIPQQLVEMPEMPLTPNGKIDRKALPDESLAHKPVDDNELIPSTSNQIGLAKIWKELTGYESVRVNHYFFDVGGHSLLSMQMIAMVQDQFGYRYKPADLVLNTLEQLAGMLPERGVENSTTKSSSDSRQDNEMASAADANQTSDSKKGFFSKLFGGKK